VTDILTEAYSDRIVRLNAWIRDGQLYVGVVFNANTDFRRHVDRGPHPKAETAAAYRDFWGDRSTLKRFPDGSLLEGVSWGDSPLEEIASFALSRHYHEPTRIQFAPIALDPLFELPSDDLEAVSPSGAFDELVIVLRSIDTTLKINSVSTCSPYLRNTAVFPYEPVSGLDKACSLCPPSIRIIARLEGSPAWPLSLIPLLQFKIAVYIEFANRLAERNISAAAHYDSVTILIRGFIFELQAFHLNEASDFAGTPHGARVRLADFTETIHHSYTQGLYNRFSSFSETCRSDVRWVRSKGMPSGVLRQEAIELLVAHAYQSPHPPASAYRGLFEFLSLLASGRFGLTVCIQRATPVGDWPLVIVTPQHCQRSEFTATVSAAVLRFMASAAV
jgi:U3 small nucleolar RNA-associated protein 22